MTGRGPPAARPRPQESPAPPILGSYSSHSCIVDRELDLAFDPVGVKQQPGKPAEQVGQALLNQLRPKSPGGMIVDDTDSALAPVHAHSTSDRGAFRAPVNVDHAGLSPERAVLGGVGGELVEGHGHGLCDTRGKLEFGSMQEEIASLDGAESLQFKADQLAQFDGVRRAAYEQALGARQGIQAALEGGAEILQRMGAATSLLREGADVHENVLRPVLELAHEHLLLAFAEARASYVLDGEQNPILVIDAAGIEHHHLMPDLLEVVLYFEIVEGAVRRKNMFQELTQTGDVPLIVSQLVNETSDGGLGTHVEGGVEALVAELDAQVTIEHQQRIAHGVDGLFGELFLSLQLEAEAFLICNIAEFQQDAIGAFGMAAERAGVHEHGATADAREVVFDPQAVDLLGSAHGA